MADFTKEEVLALAEWINSKARHEQSTGGCDKLTSAATALRALAKSMDAAPVGYIGRIGLLSLEPDVGFAEISKQRDAVYHTPLFVAPPASAPAEPVAGGALEDVVEWHKKEIADLEGQIERNNAYKRKVGSHDDSANERCRSAIHHHRWSIDAVLRIRSALAEQPAPVAEAGAAVPAGALPPAPSYHDLHITTEDLPRTSIFNLPFNVSVSCRRTTGWTVWHRPDDRGDERLLAGEYDTHGLRLDVAGVIICDSLTAAPDLASQNGEER